MKTFFQQLFTFNKSEHRAVLLLIAILLVTFFVPKVYEKFFYHPSTFVLDESSFDEIAQFSAEYAALKEEEADKFSSNKYSYTNYAYDNHKFEKKAKEYHPFPFDPNTISIEDWQQIGLSEKQATVIDNYRKKGGKFRLPEDIRKIFVINDELKEILIPYVKIEGVAKDTSSFSKNNFYAKNENNSEKKQSYEEYKKAKSEYETYVIEINTADSAAFEKLKGIGAVLAGRIVRFREDVGGFYAIKQLKDVWGLSDSTYTFIKPHLKIDKKEVRKININKADYETFRKNPYIRGNVAKWAVNYRRNNYGFKSVDQFARVPEMSEENFKKVLPYLSLE